MHINEMQYPSDIVVGRVQSFVTTQKQTFSKRNAFLALSGLLSHQLSVSLTLELAYVDWVNYAATATQAQRERLRQDAERPNSTVLFSPRDQRRFALHGLNTNNSIWCSVNALDVLTRTCCWISQCFRELLYTWIVSINKLADRFKSETLQCMLSQVCCCVCFCHGAWCLALIR